MKNWIILDNGGETYDRYTLVDKSTGDCFGCSDEPFHPLGVGQYSHNVADSYWFVAYGAFWRKTLNVKPCIKEAIDLWFADSQHIGKPVKYSSLPDSVKQYIKQLSNG